MYQNVGMLIIFISSVILALSAISLIVPIKPLGFKNRGRAFWCALVSFAALIFAGNMLSPDSARIAVKNTAISAPIQTVDDSACGATMAEFSSLQTGMAYQRVVRIIGCDGTELSSGEFAGVRTIMFMWPGESAGGNMNAMFQDDKLINKAQLGLK